MKLSDELNSFQNIIDEFYQVFAYPAPTEPLNACVCDCCMNDELELEMRTLPLRELTQRHFYDYNSSAKNEQENPNELKYFLPKMVEIFCEKGDIHFATELNFERIKNCPKDSFTTQEWALWERFANAYLDNLLKQYPYECFDDFDNKIFEVILMFSITRIDIAPFLIRWRNVDTPQAVAHYVYSSWADYWLDDGFDTDAGFWNYSDDFLKKMTYWIDNPDNKSYFLQKIKSLDRDVIEKIAYLGDFYPGYFEKLLKKMS